MSKVRQILKLHAQDIGKKKIGLRLAMSKNTVKLYIEKYLRLKILFDELMKLNDYELDKHFHPSQERLIKACKIAHDIGRYNYRTIEEILNQKLDAYRDDEEVQQTMPQHDNIRGRHYYE